MYTPSHVSLIRSMSYYATSYLAHRTRATCSPISKARERITLSTSGHTTMASAKQALRSWQRSNSNLTPQLTTPSNSSKANTWKRITMSPTKRGTISSTPFKTLLFSGVYSFTLPTLRYSETKIEKILGVWGNLQDLVAKHSSTTRAVQTKTRLANWCRCGNLEKVSSEN